MNDIIFHQKGAAGIVTLNRPKALNALSIEMLQALRSQLIDWQSDDKVKIIILTSSSERAFCAGGDVLQAVSEIKSSHGAPAKDYFKTEYGIHGLLSSLEKPIISLVDGVIMGGGLGLARNSGILIVSETIKLAMPETAIGLFPDVGASIFLRKAGFSNALMLGMTGTMIGAGDALSWGLADYHVPSSRFDALVEALAGLKNIHEMTDIIGQFQETALPHNLAAYDFETEAIFSGSVADIIAKLVTSSHPEAENWHKTLCTRCPTSIAAIHYMLHQPPPGSIIEALNTDFKLALRMTARPDFVEGVRAILIDKDGQPKWSPSRLEDVDGEMIRDLFDFDGLPDLQETVIST